MTDSSSSMPCGNAPAAAWSLQPDALARFATDLVDHETSALRAGDGRLPERPWAADLRLDERGLGLDSLERLAIVSALGEALHLQDGDAGSALLRRPLFGDWLQAAAASLDRADARLTVRTSGSRGVSKPCSHRMKSLWREVEHLAVMMPQRRRLLTAVPAHHLYGFLFTVLLPGRLGCTDVVDVRRIAPQSLPSLLRTGDLLVSHPAHWSLVARHCERLPPGVHGVTSAAPCPDALAERLVELGLETLTQVYGSSETAGIGTRTQAGAAYALMPFWSRDAGVASRLQRREVDGPVRSHDLPDRLEWLDDRHFHVVGRLDDAVQVGGTNVFPDHVRQVLLAHPQVADAAVRLMAPGEGSRLKAFVVPAQDADPEALRSSLPRWSDARLTVPERPKAYSFGRELPRSAMGKPSDWPTSAATDSSC